MFSLKMLSIDLRIKTRHTKVIGIHTVIYNKILQHTITYYTITKNSNSKIIMLPSINRKQHGGRYFLYMAAFTWNNLPDDIRKSTTYQRSDTIKY